MTKVVPKGAISQTRRVEFEQTALPHLDALYSAALRLARGPEEAGDLLQETVLRAYSCFYQFVPGTNCRAWLLTILYNLFRTQYRRGKAEQVCATIEEFERALETGSLDAPSASRNPEDLLVEHTEAAIVRSAVQALPLDFRETLMLVDLHELNYQETAQVLNIPIGTVKSRVSRGRSLLRTTLAKATLKLSKTGSNQA